MGSHYDEASLGGPFVFVTFTEGGSSFFLWPLVWEARSFHLVLGFRSVFSFGPELADLVRKLDLGVLFPSPPKNRRGTRIG